jgi:nickel/cobalt transporter (NicO) family protein
MAILSQIPMDQREIPADLAAAASALANVIVVECPGATLAAAEAEPPPAPAPRQPPPSPFGIGLSDAPSGAWLSGPFGPFFLWIGQRQSEFYRALTGAFAEIKADGRAAFLLLGLSFLYGIFHAAGPGHGKAVITSYLFATGETVRRGIAIAFASAFVQAFTAIAVVTVAALIFRAAAQTMTVAAQWIELGSYALIVAVGLWLLWTKTIGGGHHHHHHHHHHDAGGHDHDHDHDHGHDHDHAHAHAHQSPARPASSFAAMGAAVLAVGIRPCSGAIIVLVFAISQGLFAVGIASTLVMALGTGITVALLATLAVSAHGFALRLAGTDSVVAYRVVRGLEIAAALLVLGLGLVLLGGALTVGLPG